MTRSSRFAPKSLLVCLVAAIVLRASSYFHSTVDWDESIYLIMGHAWVGGAAPYGAVFDNKPIGVYAICALIELLVGRSTVAVHLAASVAVATTAWLLYRTGRLVEREGKRAGVTAAALYLVASMNDLGLAANTELFFAPFVALAFHEVARRLVPAEGPEADAPAGPLRLFLVGLACGVAFQIKYVVVFDVVLVAALVALAAARRAGPGGAGGRAEVVKAVAPSVAPLILGGALPTIVTVAAFAATGRLHDYIFSNFVVNSTLGHDTPFSLRSLYHALREQLATLWPLWLGALGALAALLRRRAPEGDRALAGVAAAWWATSFVGALLTKRFYSHYFLQTLPAMCLLCACAANWALRGAPGPVTEAAVPARARLFAPVLAAIFLVMVPWKEGPLFALEAAQHRFLRHEPHWGDNASAAADYVAQRWRPGDQFYAFDAEPIIYFLLGVPAPTRFAFPPMLIEPRFSHVAGVDPLVEVEGIMAKRPRFVFRQTLVGTPPQSRFDARIYAVVDRYLTAGYRHDASFGEEQLYVAR
jgi:hypothetical protein